MDAKSFYSTMRKRVDDKLIELVSGSTHLPYAPLFTSARYSLSSPGKRLRPLLLIATASCYGVDPELALVPACAIEMIHTYSLIHDDLPCMDNDDLRRGQPTLHKMVPEWHALLTGDYLLTYAFEILADAPHLTADRRLDLIRSLSSRSGAHGMIGGQMIDLLCVGQPIDWEILEKMHLGKTAGLITAALECGGILAGAPKKDIETLCKMGLAIGTAFQLIDDILDYTGTEADLGKPVGSDRDKSKATAVPLLGIPLAKQKAEELLQVAAEGLASLSRPAPLLKTLFDQMVNRSK
jgi:geranylgeranyl diphosphate synthase type II